MKDDKVRKLLSNTGIFALANLLTKIIMFALVPIYTYFLSTEELGIADTVITTSSLLMPLLSIAITEAVLRFGMKKHDQQLVFSNAILVILFSFAVLIMAIPIVYIFPSIRGYYWIFALVLSCEEVLSVFVAFAKALDKVAATAKISVIQAITYVLCSVLFVIVLKCGTYGYLIALVASELISILLYLFREDLYRYINFRIDCAFLKQMISYSFPLMLNGMMWWIMQSSDKYIIIGFAGMAANGIYSIANKIPSVISLVHSTFFQAWQLSAIEEYDSEQASSYYSKIFNKYALLGFSVTLLSVTFVKPVVLLVVESSYKTAWKSSMFLCMAVLFSSFSSFFGANYSASEKTKGALWSSLIGAVTNIILNLLLIPKYETIGAAIATFMAYFVMWMVRVIDTRKYVRINVNKVTVIFNSVLLIAIIAMIYTNVIGLYVISVVLCVATVITNLWRLKKEL